MPDTFKFYGTRLSSTNATSIVSGLTGTRLINSIAVANASTASSATIKVQAFSGTNAFTLVPSHSQGTSSSSQVLLSPLPLTTDDDLQASASVGDVIDVIVSVLERTP
jgi:exo-beta-1,3-glucanase (GH17 family)